MNIDADTIANEVLLSRDNYSGAILIVEGSSDEKLYNKFANDPEMVIIPSWGKDNALSAIEILDSASEVGVLAIIDADFRHIDGPLPSTPNVLLTDDHDIEMMIIHSNSMESFLGEMVSQSKVCKFLEDLNESCLVDALINRTKIIGHLRRLSTLDQLSLCFEGLKFDKFVDRLSLDVDIPTLIRNVLALTRNSDLVDSDLIDRMNSLIEGSSEDPYQLCCGHDFIAILGIGLRKAIGNKSKEITSAESLESALRLSFDSQDFQITALYRKVKNWERSNLPFIIFG